MSFQRQPDATHTRARAMSANFLEAMEREATRLEQSGDKAAATHIRAVINATRNAVNLRLKDMDTN
ncbi:hypothetical protein LP7551_02096 [Roseibium album]|nr:hypothetical protein LP7551_02096 [Roseibium album]